MISRKNNIHLLSLMSLFVIGQSYAEISTPKETLLTDHVAHKYLTSNFKEEKIESPVIDENSLSFIERFKYNFNKQFDPKKQTLTDRETQKIAFNLINTSAFKTTVIDSSFIDKLEIVGGGENSQQHLLGTVFYNVHTAMGKANSALFFSHPTTDLSLLRNRQAAIAQLSAHSHFTSKTDTALATMAHHENKALIFCHTNPPVNPELLKFFYFNALKPLNTNTVALETSNRLMNILQLLLGSVYMPALITYCAAEEWNRGYLETAKIIYIDTLISPIVPLSIKVRLAISLAAQGLLGYTQYTTLKNTGQVANHLQDILIGSASYIKELKNLSALVCNNKELLNNLPSLQSLADFNDTNKRSANLNKFLGMLDTNTFVGEPSFWSVTGRIFAAYELMKQVKDELAPVFAAAGELDMYVALAKLYTSQKEHNAQYCMVNFIENSTTPIIDAQEFWNPFVNPDVVVTNSITFDASCPNSILTGPNTGGKSTVIKAIMIDILMAQTCGIAAAKSFTLTPFTKLNCFMNISDDIATGASLFKSEVMRAKKLLDMVQDLQPNEFSFVIIDEVFTGTSPQEGEMAALRFATKLGSYPNSTNIIATHYPKMTTLEESTNGVFKNHHVEVLRNEDETLNRTFKFKSGPSFFNVAFDILEEEGLFV